MINEEYVFVRFSIEKTKGGQPDLLIVDNQLIEAEIVESFIGDAPGPKRTDKKFIPSLQLLFSHKGVAVEHRSLCLLDIPASVYDRIFSGNVVVVRDETANLEVVIKHPHGERIFEAQLKITNEAEIASPSDR